MKRDLSWHVSLIGEPGQGWCHCGSAFPGQESFGGISCLRETHGNNGELHGNTTNFCGVIRRRPTPRRVGQLRFVLRNPQVRGGWSGSFIMSYGS